MGDETQEISRRSYPPFWEKIVPFVVGLIGLLVLILVWVIIAVALGFLPGTG